MHPVQEGMVTRVGEWLQWVYQGAPGVSEERSFPAMAAAFPEADEISPGELSYYSALV